MTRHLIGVALLTLASAAHGQTTDTIGDVSPDVATAVPTESRPKDKCKGRIAGRWRVYFNDPVTFCTFEVRRDGTIRKKADARTGCRGVILDPTGITNGKLDRFAPLSNEHGSSNQCWIRGKIKTEAGSLEIFEAFIAKGSGSFSGVGLYLDGSATVVTGVRY